MEVKGRDLVAGLLKTLTITSQEVREALLEPISTIVESVRVTLERCPPLMPAAKKASAKPAAKKPAPAMKAPAKKAPAKKVASPP